MYTNSSFANRYASDRSVSEREVDIRTRTTRGNLVRQLGLPLHAAWPDWNQNVAADFWNLYLPDPPTRHRLLAFLTGQRSTPTP